jgi:glycosyltransferase involved in cell wall biosynthesis
MKIGILGCRGIPNAYGGFEQFAQYLSEGLVKRGHSVTVYNSSHHPYQKPQWNGVQIVHIFDPEKKIGTIGQFIYDLNCMLDARKRDFDVILQLGYTSSSVWHKFYPAGCQVITNMDGLEWKRSKFSKPVQMFLKYAEKLAALHGGTLVADSLGIQEHLQKTYQKASAYIPYGATVFTQPSPLAIMNLDVNIHEYDLLVARLEPENNIEMILEGFQEASVDRDFLVVGDYFTEYGLYLKEKFNDVRIKFLGKIYDITVLNNLRFFSNLYFHGHSVGGTNPSLLEAMASDALVCAHDNIFNRSILKEDAYYFQDSDAVAALVASLAKDKGDEHVKLQRNREKISKIYNWPKIITAYETLMFNVLDLDVPVRKTEVAQAVLLNTTSTYDEGPVLLN